MPTIDKITGYPVNTLVGSTVYSLQDQMTFVSNGVAWIPSGGQAVAKLMVLPPGIPGQLGGLLVNADSTIPPLVYMIPLSIQSIFPSNDINPFINDPGANYGFVEGQTYLTILKKGTYNISIQVSVLGPVGLSSMLAQVMKLPTTGIFSSPPILTAGAGSFPFTVPPISLVYQRGVVASSSMLTELEAGDQIGIVIFIDAPGQVCEIPIDSSIMCIERVSVRI